MERRGDEDDAVNLEDIDRVLRAELTPTTPFCLQTLTLTIGSFRAWNGLSERQEYDLVRVRAAPMHHQSEAINEQFVDLEETYLETGDVTADPEDAAEIGSNPMERSMENEGPSRGSTDAPFWKGLVIWGIVRRVVGAAVRGLAPDQFGEERASSEQ